MFYENGLKFKCQRCSFCCGKTPGVCYLSKSDLELLCVFFNMKECDFIEKYCRWVPYYEGKTVLALKELRNHDCILWNNGCSAYEARPVQCRTYPFWSWIVSDEETWLEIGRDCPGINKGELFSKEFIESQKKLYDQNVPMELE